ncbi:MAG: helix-turn-helix domain-containing protein [Candidatus Marsarchaeota archaeon]|jgi:putative transcriptional regulator|nr:helix-turn-helix domain-containing protein [Candidatus Marsarchaeota archaeon]
MATQEETMELLEARIAGEITLSETPGSVMKKWRELFGVTQTDLAKNIGISNSTISDYEGNRRVSPGVGVIKRFVETLFNIDEGRGSSVIKSLSNVSMQAEESEPMYVIHDFGAAVSGSDFARIIDGKVIANPNYLDSIKLFGYTRLDSLRIILEMSPAEYPKLFGATSERAFIFEGVSTGRTPLVVIRVAPIKPKLVVLHNVQNIDKLAIKIARIEKLPLITTKLNSDEIYGRLGKL